MHLTGRESENDRTRTGAASPVGAGLVVFVLAAGPQPLSRSGETRPSAMKPQQGQTNRRASPRL
jgi:hypothetical protein